MKKLYLSKNNIANKKAIREEMSTGIRGLASECRQNCHDLGQTVTSRNMWGNRVWEERSGEIIGWRGVLTFWTRMIVRLAKVTKTKGAEHQRNYWRWMLLRLRSLSTRCPVWYFRIHGAYCWLLLLRIDITLVGGHTHVFNPDSRTHKWWCAPLLCILAQLLLFTSMLVRASFLSNQFPDCC